MSEAEAVPLPREGEVFFDVRGEARCMRLSWYADSAIAVFSIWQGNRCTGTFRLPFKDLARMTQILQSGPIGPAVTGQPGHGYPEREATAQRGGAHAARREPAPAYGGAHDGRVVRQDQHSGRGFRAIGGPGVPPDGRSVPPDQHSGVGFWGVVPPDQHSGGGFRAVGGPGVPPDGRSAPTDQHGGMPYDASQRRDASRHGNSGGGYPGTGYPGAGYPGADRMYGDNTGDHDRGSLPGYGEAPWQGSAQALPTDSRQAPEPRYPGHRADRGYLAGDGYPGNAGYQAVPSYPAEPGDHADYEAARPRAASPVYAGHVTGQWMPVPTVPPDMPRTGGDDLESDWGPTVPGTNAAPSPGRAATGYPRI